ncbi:MAG: hypothetical protein KKG47_13600 [Proteobacteria bacterium]|nr:hypothetical protein [Pseudomonadota bacterium]MBU1737463.1 hypothetical protein [Pseudomonadota bacterium]
MEHEVTVFRSCLLSEGQKIHIADGPRRGDWLVIGATERKVQLRCPVSGREVEWDRFCYFVETRRQKEWPVKE